MYKKLKISCFHQKHNPYLASPTNNKRKKTHKELAVLSYFILCMYDFFKKSDKPEKLLLLQKQYFRAFKNLI